MTFQDCEVKERAPHVFDVRAAAKPVCKPPCRKVRKVADLFCGAGGSSLGARRALDALGFDMDLVCVNHWDVAIETHKRNHPTARHRCEDIAKLQPRDEVPGGTLADGRVVEIDGRPHVLDIRFRMLEPYELAAAMGFSDEETTYEFSGNKAQVTKQVGNAVPVRTAAALVAAMMAE